MDIPTRGVRSVCACRCLVRVAAIVRTSGAAERNSTPRTPGPPRSCAICIPNAVSGKAHAIAKRGSVRSIASASGSRKSRPSISIAAVGSSLALETTASVAVSASQARRRWSGFLRRGAEPQDDEADHGHDHQLASAERLVAPGGVADQSRHEQERCGAGEPVVTDQGERERHAEQRKRPGREWMPRAERVEPANPVAELAREEQCQQPDAAQTDTVGDDSPRAGPGSLAWPAPASPTGRSR